RARALGRVAPRRSVVGIEAMARERRAHPWLIAALAAAALPIASLALADAIDPSMPAVVVTGPPSGFAARERLHGRRAGLSRARWPDPPVEAWRRQVSGGLELPPVVDEDGAVLVALTLPEIMKVGPDGKELWRRRIGTTPAVAPPILTSDGSIAIVNSA